VNPKTRTLLALATAAILTGCGGGGGKGGNDLVSAIGAVLNPLGGPTSQPKPTQPTPSGPCGTINGVPVPCVPTQMSAINSAVNDSSGGTKASFTFAARSPAERASPKHQSFGSWNGGSPVSGPGASLAGGLTPASAMPTKGRGPKAVQAEGMSNPRSWARNEKTVGAHGVKR
jgi:hypothetical protein